MATEHTRHSNQPESTDYDNCLITPMGRNGDTPIRTEHVIDATLVGVLAFAAVILVDVVPALLGGQAAYLTPGEILSRIPTALVGFLLAFAFQWLRARGIDAMELFKRLFGGD